MPNTPCIAVSTGSLWPLGTLESVKTLISMGNQNIELMLQMEDFFLNFEREFIFPIQEDLLELVHSGKVQIGSIHAPAIPTEHGFSSRARREHLQEYMRVCQQFGASILVLHPFYLFKTYEETLDYLEGKNSDVWEVLLPGSKEIFREAEQKGICITLENILIWADDKSGFFVRPENMTRFLEDVNMPALDITLDIVHALICGNLEACLELHQNAIRNVHLADLIPPMQRVPLGAGRMLSEAMLEKIQNLPALEQVTIELSRSNAGEIKRCLRFLQKRFPDQSLQGGNSE